MPENPTGPPFLHNTVFQADTLPPVCSRRLGRKAAKRHDAAWTCWSSHGVPFADYGRLTGELAGLGEPWLTH